VDYIEAKQIIAPALNAMVGGSADLFNATGGLIIGAINRLVAQAVTSGDVRSDIEPLDLLRALLGVSNVASAPNWAQSAKRLVGILILGLRPE
jgi:hypothetical protein